jgi:phosphatidylserine/phosphatidylglycerophosphate/cardiolipin synthase-like enzyme
MDEASTRQLVAGDLETGLRLFSADYVSNISDHRRALGTPISLATGTGYSIYTSTIVPAIQAARHEVILVTCFWAESATRDVLSTALRQLSAKAMASSPPKKIRVQICFSSGSLARNMLLPTPGDGQRYTSQQWHKLGLPEELDIPGLDLTVTRKFFWPFGIIHSKYVIVDRDLAMMPSCNVSWERWFETAIILQGAFVNHLLDFHTSFWLNGGKLPEVPSALHGAVPPHQSLIHGSIATTLLPSPHTPTLLPPHLRPSSLLRMLPCIPSKRPTHPHTPLLTTTTHLLDTACKTITLTTPNVTAPTVIESLSAALTRGVRITIHTNRTLMTLEQLVTAGTTTPLSLSRLVKQADSRPHTRGLLRVHYFDDPESGPGGRAAKRGVKDAEKETTPVKLHAKVTIVDDDKLLLGSGNMDAASWHTSQELGVLLEGRDIVREWKKQWPYGNLDG